MNAWTLPRLFAALATLCAPSCLTAAYVPYYSDGFDALNSAAWYVNGGATVSGGYLGGGGSLISKIPVPGGTSEGEVSMNVFFGSVGASVVAYLRATPDAQLQPTVGTFHAAEVRVVQWTDSTCLAEVRLFVARSGVLTQLFSRVVPCAWRSNIRAAIRDNLFTVSVNGVFAGHAATQTGWPPDTRPGVSAYGAPVDSVSLGPLDRVGPSPVGTAAIGAIPFPNRVEFQWKAPADDPNGTGVERFDVVRVEGSIHRGAPVPLFTDEAVVPGTTYNYDIYAIDHHFNYSAPTRVTVTTPPTGSLDPIQIGVRPNGAYWGAAEEQIDLRSGNLNYSIPLVQAQGRNGHSVTFGLT